MPAYEICYLDEDGALTYKFTADCDDDQRAKILAHLKTQSWTDAAPLNVTVNGGVVDLWGLVDSDSERNAIRVAAEATHGVRAVNDNMRVRPAAALV